MSYHIGRLAIHHDRDSFVCREHQLTDYFQRIARQHQERNLAHVWVLTHLQQPEQVLGFYTLSAGQMETRDLPIPLQKKYPPHPVPMILMGRMAVHQAQERQGFGAVLVLDAVKRAFGSPIGAVGLVVDALRSDLVPFYARLGFVPNPHPGLLRLFLPRPRGW